MRAVAARRGDTTYAPVTRPALVVVADARVRADVARRLRGVGATTVMEAASLTETRGLPSEGSQDGLAILDLGLPDGSALVLLPELRRQGFTRIVLLSASDDAQSVRAALSAGVRGYLTVHNHHGWKNFVPRQPVARPAAGPLSLSAREVQVLQLVAHGRSNREIGDGLDLSALTVKSHLARIGRKLGSGDRAEMVAVAMRSGLVS